MNGALRLRRIPIDTYREPVAYLPRHSTACRPEELQALAKVELAANGRRILATLNLIDHDDLLAPDEVGLSEPAFAHLALPEGTAVTVEQAAPPKSLAAVHAKIQ